ncbi:MAG: DUF6305 family protein [Candidatus Aminicenantaceae bacterium]
MRTKAQYQIPLLGLIVLALYLAAPMGAQDQTPKAQLPLLNTSAGQSQDVTTLNIICEEAGILYDYCDVPDVAMLEAGVGLSGKQGESRSGFHVEVYTDRDVYPEGTPYKTVIFAIGASLKGMGASGLTVDDEVKRLKSVVEYCQQKGIFIIAVHVGGVSRRGAPGSDNERVIDAVAPFVDYLIVTKDSNKDGRFSQIAKAISIPLTEVDYALNLVDVLKGIFDGK